MVPGGAWVEIGGLGGRGQGRAGAMTILTEPGILTPAPHDHASVQIWAGHSGWRPEPGTPVDRVLLGTRSHIVKQGRTSENLLHVGSNKGTEQGVGKAVHSLLQ